MNISHTTTTDLAEELLELAPGGGGDHCPLPPLSALLQLRGRGRGAGGRVGSSGLIHLQPLQSLSFDDHNTGYWQWRGPLS